MANPATGEVSYAPPEGADRIRDMLSARERFVYAPDDLDQLVRVALAHYQFEAIHPFHDGNGRTGRVLNILMLIEAGLLETPILYVSRSIIGRKSDYYRPLSAVTSAGAWTEWIVFMLETAWESAVSTVAKIAAVRECHEVFAMRARAATAGGRDARMLDVLFEQPYCRITTVAQRCGVSRQTASAWLHSLVHAGLLLNLKVGREQLCVNHELLQILTRPD